MVPTVDASPGTDAGTALRDSGPVVPEGGPETDDGGAVGRDAGPPCAEGEAECGGECVDLGSDVLHCGGCGVVCEAANAVVMCEDGACGLSACEEGWGDCDGTVESGCERDLMTDDTSCGACGHGCDADAELCAAGACVPTGESCDSPLELTDGRNTVPWRASVVDYPAAVPECDYDASAEADRDLVARYVASETGYVRVSMPDSDDAQDLLIVRGRCGERYDALECSARGLLTGGGPPAVTFATRAGRTYYLFLYSDGAAPEPLIVDVDPIDCATDPAVATPIRPASGGISETLWAEATFRFDRPVRRIAGFGRPAEVTLNGDMGTSVTFDQNTALSPREVSAAALAPHVRLQPGETVTATAAFPGLVDEYCGAPVSPVSYTFTVVTPPCLPGVGGVLGGTSELVASGASFTSGVPPLHMAAEPEAGGWLYVAGGGFGDLWRHPKDAPDLYDPVYADEYGWPTLHGTDLYVSNDTGLWRLEWGSGDMAESEHYAPLVVTGDVGFPTTYGDEIFLTTPTASGVDIWRVVAGAAAPVSAIRAAAVTGESDCRGLAVDDESFFLSCGTHRVVRFDRRTGGVSLVTDRFGHEGSATVAHDTDGDGEADALYGADYDGVFFICDPAAPAPYADHSAWFEYTGGMFGVVLDPAVPRLWAPGMFLTLDLR